MAGKSVVADVEDYQQALQERSLYEPSWQEIGTFILPKRADILFRNSPGTDRMSRVFDSTAIFSNVVLAASMQGSLVSNSVRWFSLGIRGVDLAKEVELRAELDKCADAMYAAIQQSNHQSESSEMCLDLGAFGIGAMLVEENDPKPGMLFSGLRHTALHPGEYCIGENADGYVDTVYRSFKLPAKVAERKWGNRLSEPTLKKAASPKQGMEQIEFLQIIRPNDYGSKRTAKFPIYSCYIEPEAKHRIEESGYFEMPVVAPRWSKNTGERYGTGPGHIAIHDAKTLNKAVELKLRAWALMVNPPLQVRDQGVVGTLKLNPFGLTHVRDMESIKPLWEIGGRLDVANMEEDKLRMQIRRVYYSDQLQLQDGPQMTAMEAQIRYELMQRVLGPTLGRLEVEWLNSYIERVFNLMLRRSPKDSPFRRVKAILDGLGKPLDIEYEGPLARAQRLQESIAVQRFFQIALPLQEVNDTVLDNVNMDEVIDIHAFATGMPARALNTPATKAKIRADRAQAQKEANDRQKAADLAQFASTGATAAKALADASGAQVVPPIAGNLAVGATPAR